MHESEPDHHASAHVRASHGAQAAGRDIRDQRVHIAHAVIHLRDAKTDAAPPRLSKARAPVACSLLAAVCWVFGSYLRADTSTVHIPMLDHMVEMIGTGMLYAGGGLTLLAVFLWWRYLRR